MKVRMMWVVLLAVAAGAGAVAQPFDPSTGSGSSRATSRDDTLRAAPSAVEGQQPPVPVPSAAPTVQAGDTRPHARLHPVWTEVARRRGARLSAVQR